jgi:hypothetical protein
MNRRQFLAAVAAVALSSKAKPPMAKPPVAHPTRWGGNGVYWDVELSKAPVHVQVWRDEAPIGEPFDMAYARWQSLSRKRSRSKE